jgi:hypothetical protein
MTAARAVPAGGQLVCVVTVDVEAGVALVPWPAAKVGTFVLLPLGSGVCPPLVPVGDGAPQAASSTSRQQQTVSRRLARND